MPDEMYKWMYVKNKSLNFNQILQVSLLLQYLHLLIVDLEVDCQGQRNLRSNMEMAISQEVIAQGSNELVGRGLHSLSECFSS